MRRGDARKIIAHRFSGGLRHRKTNQVPSGTKALSSLTGLVWLVWPEGPAINGWAILKKSPRNEGFGHVAEENEPECGRHSTENSEEPDKSTQVTFHEHVT
jgi:hypothetical protein